MTLDPNTDRSQNTGNFGLKNPSAFRFTIEIVRYREERGGYSDLGQLEEVPGLASKIDGSSAALTVDAG